MFAEPHSAVHPARRHSVPLGRCARHSGAPGWGLTPVSRPHIHKPGDHLHTICANFRSPGPPTRASLWVSDAEEPSLTLKECPVGTITLERTLTELDHVRLLNLLRRDARGAASQRPFRAIEDLLEASALVPSREVAPDVVTMYSQVLLQDTRSSQRHKLALCYPVDAEPAIGFVSVLSPVGSALLGLRVGSIARWSTPAGDDMAAEILAILFQPESSGDYTM
jgi:regulator of nucleoside diphosphate kinase